MVHDSMVHGPWTMDRLLPRLRKTPEDPRREPLPDFNDEGYPQDDPTGTFRGTKIKLSELIAADIDWEQLIV